MKKIMAVVLSAALSMSLTVHGFADDLSETDCRSFTNVFDNGEFDEVMGDVKGDYFANEAGALSAYSARDNSDSRAYKLYRIISANFVKELFEGTDISELISTDYSWMLPTPNSVTKVIRNDEGKWEAIGYGEISPEYTGDTILYDKANSAITEFLADSTEEIRDVICIDATALYFTNFVCVTLSSGGVYLIPFGMRPDFTGLTDGKMYSVDEVYTILSDTMGVSFGTVTDNNAGVQYGGAGIASEPPEQTVPLPVIIIPAALIAVGIAAVVIWENKKVGKRKAK
ncbi:MAG: hypothetical protein K2N38_05165 [Oscillospiraceae bacterium]|nr:hypothetical protein [Oscillospiraceae bacterium]